MLAPLAYHVAVPKARSTEQLDQMLKILSIRRALPMPIFGGTVKVSQLITTGRACFHSVSSNAVAKVPLPRNQHVHGLIMSLEADQMVT